MPARLWRALPSRVVGFKKFFIFIKIWPLIIKKNIYLNMERIKTYQDFYKFYLTEHSDTTCRILHFIGTSIIFIIAFFALYLNQPKLWISVPIVGYGFAWVGHFFFEKNKPATFKYPLWSLISDFKMFFQILTGNISFKSAKD